VNGWRPTSVVTQPAITATKPDGPMISAARWSARQSCSRRLSRAHRLHKPRPSISRPIPTMTRNDQKITAAGG
jgi:hypothetical protein